MSIGPSERKEIEGVPVIKRFSASAQKTFTQYFVRPAYYLFYSLLTLGAIALLINREPSVKFWGLLVFVGILNIGKTSSQELPVANSKKNSNAKRK